MSHIRSVLHWMRAPLGVMEDTECLIRGSIKLTMPSVRRYKARASAQDTRLLIAYARRDLERCDVADSWAIARQFCLRYGKELVPLEWEGSHSQVLCSTAADGRAEVSITLFQRKLQQQPVEIVRRCICTLQGRALCGVCAL